MDLLYPFTISVTLLTLLVYHWVMLRSGMARVKFKVDAPSTDGPDDYRRIYRAHVNMLEHMASFLPAMWMFAVVVSDVWAASIGLVWVLGRIGYAVGYYTNADRRIPGLLVSFLAAMALIFGSIGAIVLDHI